MNSALDEALMRRAIELSKRGFPAPNPHVGCVLAQGDRVVGEGWHEYAGARHAEGMALDNAGGEARGATCYVSQEPCNGFGRRGPCSQALIKAGVARVVFAVRDPNPSKAGGMETLLDAGIPVEAGLLEKEAAAENRFFLFRHRVGRPFVAVKAATTLDGFIARPDGTSKWITGPEAREAGHWLRAELGCVLVGRETVAFDDPELTARLDGVVNQPLRAILDPSGRLTGQEKVFRDSGAVWFVAGEQAPLDAVPVPVGPAGFDLHSVLAELGRRGMIGVLVEGGGRTIRTFLEAGLVDEIHLFQAPRLFGEGRPWAGGANLDLSEYAVSASRLVGRDSWTTFRRSS